MANEIGNGTAGKKISNPFAGKYFKQTANIDLEGNILPSIGFYTGNNVKKAYRYNGTDLHYVFGGIYDGNGYHICNGYVTSQGLLSTDKNNNAWGAGLFGIIYGATIKNVTLREVSVYQYNSVSGTTARKLSCVGLLVGVAVGGTDAKADCNVIENCYVDSSCSIECKLTGDGRNKNDEALLHYRWGGLVGFAMDTTIINCTNEADITVQGCVGATGGLVGCMTSGVIENCVNKGDITVATTATAKETGARAYGGLVGVIPDLMTQQDTVAAAIGVKIDNSTNCGNISVTKLGTNVCYFGGIVGAALKLQQNTYSIAKSYNMGTLPSRIDTTNVGAVVGYASGNEDANRISFFDVYSVDVNGETADIYYNDDEKNIIVATNCGTKSAKEIDMLGLCKIYIQQHNNTNGSYRFVATINGAEWDSAKFTVTLIKADNDKTRGTKEISVTTCYDSILVNGETVTDPSGRKFIVLAIEGIGEGWSYEVSVSVTDSTGTYDSPVQAGKFG